MSQYKRGTIFPMASGAIQYIQNVDRGREFILVTGRHEDIYIPIDTLSKALDEAWTMSPTMRGKNNE